MKPITLFCFPFAGGNKYSYREYEQNIPNHLNMLTLEYPGRGTRAREPFVTHMVALVEDLYRQIKHLLDKGDYAFYGHSMGGIVAYYLVKRILSDKKNMPLHLFITGTMAPSTVLKEEKKRHLMDKTAFLQEIRELDGCPDEILKNEEMLNYFEPILRADFEASEAFTYTYDSPLDIPITVITGSEEDMELSDIQAWQLETKCTVDFRTMPGTHFFINKYPREIVDIISEKLFVHSKSYQS